MSELKRTQLYDIHVAAGAELVDFGGWEMPIQYPSGIIAEHLYTRQVCSLFDVSHMGRLRITGPERKAFLQHVLSSNVSALDLNMAQYCIIPDNDGGAVDDAYLYLFEEDSYLLVVNAANTDKDLAHLYGALKGFDCQIENITGKVAAIAVQGPKCKELLTQMAGGTQLTEPMKNALGTVTLEGHTARVAKTGYTGEPLGYEVYVRSEDAAWLWNRLIELGARPAGLGARDTLRLEAALPLYGHEMGTAPDGSVIPIFAVPLSKFAVSFAAEKGDFIGRAALEKQHESFVRHMDRDFSDLSVLPRKIAPIALLDRGVMRAGMEIYQGDKLVGWVTSGTMVPYFKTEGEGLETVILEASGKRAIGLCYIDSDILEDDTVEVDVRGKRLKAVIPVRHMSVAAPPYARPLIYGMQEEEHKVGSGDRAPKALELLTKALENHQWRQEQCINLIPSENTPSRAVRVLSGSDPCCRYAEHKKVLAFYDKDIFYYQGTQFIDKVEQLLVEEMRAYFGCTEVETRTLSGQMSNMAVFSSLMDWKNRADRKVEAKRLGYVMNKEPVAAIRQFVDEQKIPTTIMYDMAHVLGLIGDHFQNPFAEGAEIVTGSTHKTFFGPQRGVIGVNYKEEDLKYGLWKTIETRTFPGSVSNHHLGTQVGMLMAAYEMNQFKDEYQKAVTQNAKSFARSLKAEGLDVMGDPAIDYTETHQVIVSVGYGEGAEIANRLERNNVIVNYQATPDEEGFTASGALRMGVSEMTRFGFGEKEFAQLASLMADCILRGKEIGPDVAKLRSQHLEMGYCFNDAQFEDALEKLAEKAGL